MGSKNRQSNEVEQILQVEFHWTKFIPVFLVIAGLTQFVIGISAAVHYFPRTFSFERQFLSELGQTRLPGQVTNTTSCMFFTGTMILLGMSLVPMFLTVKDHSGDADVWSRGLGVGSTLAVIGIGITPFDRMEFLHLTALGCWLLSLAGMAFMRIFRLLQTDSAGSLSGCISVGLILAITFYVTSFRDRSTSPITQKVAILAAIFWGLDLLREVSKYTVDVMILRRTHHRAVEDYLARLSSRPLYRAKPPEYQPAPSSTKPR